MFFIWLKVATTTTTTTPSHNLICAMFRVRYQTKNKRSVATSNVWRASERAILDFQNQIRLLSGVVQSWLLADGSLYQVRGCPTVSGLSFAKNCARFACNCVQAQRRGQSETYSRICNTCPSDFSDDLSELQDRWGQL